MGGTAARGVSPRGEAARRWVCAASVGPALGRPCTHRPPRGRRSADRRRARPRSCAGLPPRSLSQPLASAAAWVSLLLIRHTHRLAPAGRVQVARVTFLLVVIDKKCRALTIKNVTPERCRLPGLPAVAWLVRGPRSHGAPPEGLSQRARGQTHVRRRRENRRDAAGTVGHRGLTGSPSRRKRANSRIAARRRSPLQAVQ